METGQAVDSGFLEANGTRFYYEMAGEGEPLLLIHGFNLDNRMWDEQVAALAESYKVIRFDLRGFGKTPATNLPFTLYDDVRAVLAGLGIEKAHVAGLSFGGMVAQEFALVYPQMVKSLVLISSGLFGHSRSEQRLRDMEQFHQLLEAKKTEEALEQNTRMWFDGPGCAANTKRAKARELFASMSRNAFSLPAFGEGLVGLTPPPKERLGEIKAPTLVIAGARDYIDFLQIADELAERIERAEKVILTDSAHIPPMDQPEVVNELILRFLKQQSDE
ncbi:alpha/beta fold hydrolase [Brevibacillus agri]|uniref:alpha/beta fold hydrolase n=1 Tax=Brevibacillus agri TaxID=51101 RepID=UPI0002A4DF50|nr:alpha/beta hydrolase [Brevibacillus agri]ELK41563.1 pimeloyl-CoA synthesis protein [Brevibacillus agri BAB-2500]MDN4093762.1 alpha/beta hydrolase [Brevibacillus agri]MED3499308.1 alpha/beta hydrolase [Brevibacillus agri]